MIRFGRQRLRPLDQLRAELDGQFGRMAKWELRKHLEADHALSLFFATMRGEDLQKIRAILDDRRMDDPTQLAKIREVMDNVW